MKTVIGLVAQPEKTQNIIENLRDFGFKKEQFSILTNPNTVWRRLGGEQHNLMLKEIGLGALAGIVFADSFALIGLLETMVFGAFDPILATVVALQFTFIGAALGGIIGGIHGADAVEAVNHVYIEGVRRGGAMIVVETSDHVASRALRLFQKNNVAAVKIHTEADLTEDLTSLSDNFHFPPMPATIRGRDR